MVRVDLRDIVRPEDRALVMALRLGPGQDKYLNSMEDIFAEVGKGRLIDIALVVEGDADLVDHLVAATLADQRADQPGLVAVDVVLAQDLHDGGHARFDAGLVGSGAILAEEVFEHVGGNNSVALDELDQVFADD